MSSETETAETSDALAPAPEPSQTENVPPASNDAPHSTSLPKETDENSLFISNPPTTDDPPVSIPTIPASIAVKQYPKLNVSTKHFNEFPVPNPYRRLQTI